MNATIKYTHIDIVVPSKQKGTKKKTTTKRKKKLFVPFNIRVQCVIVSLY